MNNIGFSFPFFPSFALIYLYIFVYKYMLFKISIFKEAKLKLCIPQII